MTKRTMEAHHDHDEHQDKPHRHGHGDKEKAHDHDHEGHDPHIWTSPAAVKVQARNILQGLLEVRPDRRETFEKNYREFMGELDDLDREIRSILGPESRGKRFIVFHPAWGYFADAYGLVEVAIEVEGKEPKPAELKKLIDHSREMEAAAIFVQPQFSRKSAETIARAIGAQVVDADPLAPDWADNLKRVAAQIREAVR